MQNDIEAMTRTLEKMINTKVEGKEIPRLVRANSAFELLAALQRAEGQPELAKMMAAMK